jgi:hypothetical protein
MYSSAIPQIPEADSFISNVAADVRRRMELALLKVRLLTLTSAATVCRGFIRTVKFAGEADSFWGAKADGPG